MPDSDLQAFYEALLPVRVTGEGSYTPEDRYRDFREVFYGSNAGKRVLAQIMDECEGPPVGEAQIESHAYLAMRAGKRTVGARIVLWMNAAPPDVAIVKEDDNG